MAVSFRAVLPAALFLALVPFCFLCCFCFCRCRRRRSRDVEEAVYNNPPAVQPVDAARGKAEADVQPVDAARGKAEAAAVQPVDAARKHLRIFDYEVLEEATKSFSEEAEIGRGSFGVVYKATIDNELRAVKKLKDKIPDETHFKEIDAAGELRHRNLVQLVGYSYEPKRQALLMVFECVPNGNLHHHLVKSVLRWEDRYKIALGLASGVEYLHSGCKKCLIHRDIKPDNVMLANDFTPQLGDFGLARLTDHDASMKTTDQAGTFGYMAPEIFTCGAKATKESDVFSFGVVLLQIATGQKDLMVADVELPLVSWVWSLHDEGRVLDAVDKRLPRGEYDADQATHLLVVGLLCCHSTASGRPTIDQAKSMLKDQPLMPVKPLEGYYKDALSKTPTTRTTAKEKHKNIGATTHEPSKVPPGPTPNTLKSSPKVPQGATAPNKPLNPIQAGSSSKYYTAAPNYEQEQAAQVGIEQRTAGAICNKFTDSFTQNFGHRIAAEKCTADSTEISASVHRKETSAKDRNFSKQRRNSRTSLQNFVQQQPAIWAQNAAVQQIEKKNAVNQVGKEGDCEDVDLWRKQGKRSCKRTI